jgi:hypothetical protein
MSDTEALIDQLRRSNRRWKAVALTACFALVLVALFGFIAAARQRFQTEAAMRDLLAAQSRAQMATNPAEPR